MVLNDPFELFGETERARRPFGSTAPVFPGLKSRGASLQAGMRISYCIYDATRRHFVGSFVRRTVSIRADWHRAAGTGRLKALAIFKKN